MRSNQCLKPMCVFTDASLCLINSRHQQIYYFILTYQNPALLTSQCCVPIRNVLLKMKYEMWLQLSLGAIKCTRAQILIFFVADFILWIILGPCMEHAASICINALGSFLSMKELDWLCFSQANSIVLKLFLVSLHQTVDLNYITTWQLNYLLQLLLMYLFLSLLKEWKPQRDVSSEVWDSFGQSGDQGGKHGYRNVIQCSNGDWCCPDST